MFLTTQRRVAVGVDSSNDSGEGPVIDTKGLVSVILVFVILTSAILVTTMGLSSRTEGFLTAISAIGRPRNSQKSMDGGLI